MAALPDPIGETVTASRRPNGLDVRQVRVPLGVIFMIFESRPNVTVDAAALCVKSGNAVILRGGKEASHTNSALHRVLADQLVALRPARGRRSARADHRSRGRRRVPARSPNLIDLAIPRGGESLIRRVVAEATMPVLKHYQGNCHVYVDSRCDLDMAVKIIVNAKVQRPGVCNAAETLLVHQAIAPQFLPMAAEALFREGVELRGDAAARSIVPAMKPRRAGRLGYRVSRQDPGRRRRRLARRRHRPHHPPRLGPHRCHRHHDLAAARASSPRSTARP